MEKLLGLEVPKRAQYIRVLLTEMTRIASHLVWVGTHAIDMGAMSVFLYCFREREDVMKIFEMVCGQRMMTSYFRIGGLALEPPTGWIDRVQRFIAKMPSRLDEYESLLTKIASGSDVCAVSAKSARQDAIEMGLSGPTLRSTGVDYDVRKYFPYSSYDEFDFRRPDTHRRRLLRPIFAARG